MARKRIRVTPESAAKAMLPDNVLMDLLDVPSLDDVSVALVEIDLIDPNRFQPRKHFNQARLEELAASMRANGFLGVLLARHDGQRYEIAFGERRLRAAKMAGLDQLPLYTKEFTDLQMMEVAVTENVNREDLTPIEEAQGYQMLVDAGYSYRKIGERIGKSSAHITRVLSLLRYDDLQTAVDQKRITATAAYEIAKVEAEHYRQRLIDQVARDQLSRSSLQEAVRVANTVTTTGQHAALTPDTSLIADPNLGPIQIYDPVPNLRSSVKQLKNIRSDLFDQVPQDKLTDVIDLLDEILFRAQSIKESVKINQG